MNKAFLRSKWFMLLAVITFVLVVVLAFRFWSKQPSQAIIAPPIEVVEEVQGSAIVLEDFDTQLFSTKMTSNLKVKNKNEVATPSILGQYLLADKDSRAGDQVAVTVGLVDTNAVGDVSPVQFRRLPSEGYTELVSDPSFPPGNVVFVKDQDFEKAVVWVADGRYVAVVATGGVQNRPQLENSLSVVITNWQWL